MSKIHFSKNFTGRHDKPYCGTYCDFEDMNHPIVSPYFDKVTCFKCARKVLKEERETPKICCFSCGKKITGRKYLVDTRDHQTVYVGPECFKHVRRAGETGYQPPLGGPMLWELEKEISWFCHNCSVEVPNGERCKHCGKTKTEKS